MERAKGKVPIYFHLSIDLDQALRELAHKEERSLAEQLRHLIRQAVSEQKAITSN